MDSIKNVLPAVIQNMELARTSDRSTIWNKWPAIAGEKISKHTKPSLTDQGMLYVWVDDSSLAFELSQKYKNAILKRAQAVLGEDKVKAVKFLVGQLR